MAKIMSIFNPGAYQCDSSLNIEAYYLTDWQGYDMPPHRHDRMEIMYVLGGKCAIGLEDGEKRLKKGEFILLDAGVPHGLTVSPEAPCRMMNIEFSVEPDCIALPLRALQANSPLFARFVSRPRPVLVFSDPEEAPGVLRKIIHCLDLPGEGRAFELELLSCELLVSLSRLFGEGGGALPPGQARLRRAMQFIRQNYFRDISLRDICTHVGVTEGYLGKVFRKETGASVIGYLTEVRMDKAKMLLEKTELPVSQVYSYVGVSSRIYFNQLFKKHTGMTPGEYRNTRHKG